MRQVSTMAASAASPVFDSAESVLALRQQRPRQYTSLSDQQPQASQPKLCQYCGRNHNRGRHLCPANGNRCSHCGKMNHFPEVCRQNKKYAAKSKIHQLEEKESISDEEESVLHNLMSITLEEELDQVNVVDTRYPSRLFVTRIVAGQPVRFQIDTGATCNVLRQADLPTGCHLRHTTNQLSLFDRSRIKPLGKCTLQVTDPTTRQAYKEEFVVVSEAATSLLGAVAVQKMGLIALKYDTICQTEEQPCRCRSYQTVCVA